MDQPRSHPLKIHVEQILHSDWAGYYMPRLLAQLQSSLIITLDRGCDRKIFVYPISKFPCFRLVSFKKTTIEDKGRNPCIKWLYYPKYMRTYNDAIKRICTPLLQKADEISITISDHINGKSEKAAKVLYDICEEQSCFNKIRSFDLSFAYCWSRHHQHEIKANFLPIHFNFLNRLQGSSIHVQVYDLDVNIVIKWLKEWVNGEREFGNLIIGINGIDDWWGVLSPHLDFSVPLESRRPFWDLCSCAFLHRRDRSASLWCTFIRGLFKANVCCKRGLETQNINLS